MHVLTEVRFIQVLLKRVCIKLSESSYCTMKWIYYTSLKHTQRLHKVFWLSLTTTTKYLLSYNSWNWKYEQTNLDNTFIWIGIKLGTYICINWIIYNGADRRKNQSLENGTYYPRVRLKPRKYKPSSTVYCQIYSIKICNFNVVHMNIK